MTEYSFPGPRAEIGDRVVYVVVWSTQHTGAEIEQTIGLPGDIVRTQGDSYEFLGKRTARESLWRKYSSAQPMFPAPDPPRVARRAPIDDHLAWLFDVVAPRVEPLERLVSGGALVRMQIVQSVLATDTDPGFSLSKDWITFLARVKAAVNLEQTFVSMSDEG